jgi:large conductance mechanosensitive channel
MLNDFKAFLIKQNAVALAIAVVIGAALNGVVTSIVDGLIMPIVATISPDPASYQNITWTLGRLVLKPGLVLAALINFLIVGLVVWRLSKLLIKPAADAPKAPTKACPFCKMGDLDLAAVRCPHCTSELAGALPNGALSPGALPVTAR